MAFKPSLQQLSSSGLTSLNGDVAVTDFTNGNTYLLGSISAAAAMKKVRILDGAGLVTQDISSYSAFPETGAYSDQSIDVSENVLLNGTGSNYCGLLYVDGVDLSSAGAWGAGSGGANYPNNVQSFVDSAATWNGSGGSFQTYFVGVATISAVAWVVAGPPTKHFIGALFNLDEIGISNRVACSGAASVAQGCCYVASWGSPQQIGIYRINIPVGAVSWDPASWPTPNGAITMDTLAKITPAMMGGGATTISCQGMVMDETDGNLLLSVITDVANYIVKYSVQTGAILWKNIVPSATPGNGANNMKFSRIRHGKYSILEFIPGGARCFTMDTISGAMTSYTTNLNGLAPFTLTGSNQCFDDTTGALIFGCVKTNVAGGPTLLNATPSAFTDWAALYVIEGFVDPVIPFSKTSYGRIWGNYV